MSLKYSNLLSPLKIGSHVIKNRMEASNSLPHFLQGPEPYPAYSVIKHYANKAKNGAAIVTCMGINNFSRGMPVPTELDFSHFPDYDLYSPTSQNYLMQLADAIHFYDSIACMGFFVGPPSYYPLMVTDKNADDPRFEECSVGIKDFVTSEYKLKLIEPHRPASDYNAAALELIAESYAEQCRLLKFLGFDMVSIHMAYGHQLPTRFLSPLKNDRTDEYSGSIENRMKFPKTVLQKVREAVGKDFIVEILMSGEESEGGYTLDDTVKFLKSVEKYIDVVQLRGPEVDVSHPTGFELKETPFLHYGEYVKKSGVDVKVAVIGGFQYFKTCENAIAEGKADIVSMARSWISNPEYGKLALEGRDSDMVPCLRCNKCHGRGKDDPFVSVCAVNPMIGIEHLVDGFITEPELVKKVAVIGGGPAGMKAAIELADRGHEVTLYEASDELGGAIKHSDYIDFKWPLKKFREYLMHQVAKRKITVKLNTPAVPEQIKGLRFDVVIAALGAEPIKPPISGVDSSTVFAIDDAVKNPEQMGERVTVIGGGEVGVEVGMHLASHGAEVTVIEMQNELAADATLIHYRTMFEEAWNALDNFSSILGATCTAITDNSVMYRDADGKENSLKTDSVVISTGMRSRSDLAMLFYGTAKEFYMIGDCKKPGTIEQAMRTAFSTAVRI